MGARIGHYVINLHLRRFEHLLFVYPFFTLHCLFKVKLL